MALAPNKARATLDCIQLWKVSTLYSDYKKHMFSGDYLIDMADYPCAFLREQERNNDSWQSALMRDDFWPPDEFSLWQLIS